MSFVIKYKAVYGQSKQNQCINCIQMDPRPYHYEYRRPRLSNPTFQSVNLYESLYHKGLLNRYENINEVGTFQPKNQFQRQIYEHSILAKKSIQLKNDKSTQVIKNLPLTSGRLSSSMMINPQYDPHYSRPNSNSSNQLRQVITDQRNSVLASYGRSTMPNDKVQNIAQTQSDTKMQEKLNQFSVYQRQQKPYSIIGNIPKTVSTSLREYPKYTMENKLIEEGKYFLK